MKVVCNDISTKCFFLFESYSKGSRGGGSAGPGSLFFCSPGRGGVFLRANCEPSWMAF